MVPQFAFQIIWLTFLIIVGAAVGSFLNVCIYRLPWEKSIIWPGSHCPKCLCPIRAYDNIPILSWLILRGRCRNCGAQFSARYMLIELLTAALFAALFLFHTPIDPAGYMRYACHAVLLAALLVATFIDLDYQIIPDAVTVPGMLAGLFGSTLWPDVSLQLVTNPAPDFPMSPEGRIIYTLLVLSGWGLLGLALIWLMRRGHDQPGTAEWVLWIASAVYLAGQSFTVLAAWNVIGNWSGWPVWFAQHPHWHGLSTSVLGLLAGAALIWIVRVVGSAAMGREAMGFGDVTLMAMVGAFLGWQAALFVFFLAPFMGLIVGLFQWVARGNNVLPYGPYLSLAALVTLFGWPTIWLALEPRLAILSLLGIVWLGGAMLAFLPILLLCIRMNWRREQQEFAGEHKPGEHKPGERSA